MSFPYAPNTTLVLDTVATTTWHKVDINGADAGSTGAAAWPNLDAGMFLQALTIRSKAAADADGGAFEYALNKTSAPSAGIVVNSGNQPAPMAPGNLHNIWVKKGTSTDTVEIVGRY